MTDYLKVLEEEFNGSKESFNILSEKLEPAIYENVISKGFLYNIRDYEKETMGFKKGKRIKTLPKRLKDVFVYHFNSEGKIIIIDSYGSSSDIIDKEFCIYEPSGIKTYYFHGGFIRLRNVTLSLINEYGKTKEVYSYGGIGTSVKTYSYFNGLLNKIHVKSKQHSNDDFECSELEFEYRDDKLSMITQAYPNGYTKIIYSI